VSIFLSEWNASQQLLMKFFSYDQSKQLLLETCPASCLGGKETVKLESLQDLHGVAQGLRSYLTFMQESLHFLSQINGPSQHSARLSRFLQSIKSQNFEGIQSLELMKTQCQQLVQKVAKQYVELGQLTNEFHNEFLDPGETKTQNRDVIERVDHHTCEQPTPEALKFKAYAFMLTQAGIIDIYNILQHSMLKIADPFFETSKCYNKRLCLNLFGWISKMNKPMKPVFTVSDDSETTQDVVFILHKIIHIDFVKKLAHLNPEILQIFNLMRDYNKNQLISLPFVRNRLQAIAAEIRPLTEEIVDELLSLERFYPDTLQTLPLVKFTKPLARWLIILHDIDILLNERSDWPAAPAGARNNK
jgi:hypothetical protein